MTVFIQHLTVRGWCARVWPFVVWQRLCKGVNVRRCEVIDGSRTAYAVARLTARLLGVRVEPLRFRLMDLRDEQGQWIRLRIAYEDLPDVHGQMLQEPVMRDAMRQPEAGARWPMYLAKSLTTTGFLEHCALWRTLLAVNVCAWHRPHQIIDEAAVFFLEQRPGFDVIKRYARAHGVIAISVPAPFQLRRWLRRRLSPAMRLLVRAVICRLEIARLRWRFGWEHGRAAILDMPTSAAGSRQTETARHPRIAVDYYGHLNLSRPERYSDLFFWQQSCLSARDLVLCFALPQDPLNDAKAAELAEHSITSVVLAPCAAANLEALSTTHVPALRGASWHHAPKHGRGQRYEVSWIREQHADYQTAYEQWKELCAAHEIQIYVTWFKYDGLHAAIGDALQRLGGIMAMYQRAYEPHPTPQTAMATDVYFGFSSACAEVERRSGSVIPYYVVTGYLGDHRVALLRDEATRLRQQLQRQGAERIVAFTDEGTAADSRWFHDHAWMQQDYVFLLEKLLSEPWLGLVIKPKVARTLRQRLGSVADLLRRAEATGRCVVHESGELHSSDVPAVAALAADVLLHSCLAAGTAGLESALAGVPTLLLDREGWPKSPLYRLGVGRVVFHDLASAWSACGEHWRRPGGLPGFGDWSSMLEEIDPFRDGCAAQRMGTYLQGLLEGLKAGADRETAMADAAERYTGRWGRHAIMSINSQTTIQPCPVLDEPVHAQQSEAISGARGA